MVEKGAMVWWLVWLAICGLCGNVAVLIYQVWRYVNLRAEIKSLERERDELMKLTRALVGLGNKRETREPRKTIEEIRAKYEGEGK